MMHCLLPEDKDGSLNCVKIDDVVMIGASKRLATPDSDWQVTICLTGGEEKSLIGLTEKQAKDAVLAFYEASKEANERKQVKLLRIPNLKEHRMYCINPGVPTSYPTDAMQCCIDCANGICNEAPDVKLWAHYVAISYAAAQALAAPCPYPGPCSIAEFEAMHKAMKSGAKMAAPFNWLALIQLLVAAAPAILQALLALLGLPTPPAKKP